MKDAADEATDRGERDVLVEEELGGNLQAVEHGLADAAELGDGSGDGDAADAVALGLEEDGQALGRADEAAEPAHCDGVVKADEREVGEPDGDEGPVQAEHDEGAEGAADEGTGERRADHGDVVDGLGEEVDGAGDHACDGADGEVGERDHDAEGAYGHEEVADDGGNDLLEPALEMRGDPHGDDDRDDAGGVASLREDHGNAEEGVVVVHREGRAGEHGAEDGCGARQVHEVRVHERRTDSHADELVEAELLRRGVADDDGQEVEERVAGGVHDHVEAARGVKPPQREEERRQALEHSCRGEGHERRAHRAGDDVHQTVEGVLVGGFLLVGGVVLGNLAGTGHAELVDQGVVHVVDLVADDDLVLAARLDDGDDAVERGEGILVGLALVLELESQARDAVREVVDVALATDVREHVACEVMKLACHVLLLGIDEGHGEGAVCKLAGANASQGLDLACLDEALVLDGERERRVRSVRERDVLVPSGELPYGGFDACLCSHARAFLSVFPILSRSRWSAAHLVSSSSAYEKRPDPSVVLGSGRCSRRMTSRFASFL